MVDHTCKAINRLRDASEFKTVFKSGQRLSDHSFRIFFLKQKAKVARVGLAVPKKVLRSAVARNRIKRLIRESFRNKKVDFMGFDVVVIATKRPQNNEKSCIRKQLDVLLARAIAVCKK